MITFTDIDDLKSQIGVEIVSSNFGDRCVFDMPEGCNMIIVCVNDGFGHKPIRLRLPHQLYVKDLVKMIEEHNPSLITVIPASSKHYINVINRF